MARYHISKNNKPAVCKAPPGECPLQGQHFASKDTAQFYLENQELAERSYTKRADLTANGYDINRVYANSLQAGDIVQIDDYGDIHPPVEVVKVDRKRENSVKIYTRSIKDGADGTVYAYNMSPSAYMVKLTRKAEGGVTPAAPRKATLTQAHGRAFTEALNLAYEERSRTGGDTRDIVSALDLMENGGTLSARNLATLKDASIVAFDEWDNHEDIADLQDALSTLGIKR